MSYDYENSIFARHNHYANPKNMISTNYINNNLTEGKLTIVAGLPSIGKTAFGFSFVANLSRQQNKVIYFSFDEPKRGIVKRILKQCSDEDL